jgi:hypothetical protein
MVVIEKNHRAYRCSHSWSMAQPAGQIRTTASPIPTLTRQMR